MGIGDIILNEEHLFHLRIIELISDNLNNNVDNYVLCFIKIGEDTEIKATLKPNEYKKSLERCLDYFNENEYYEECQNINNLINKYEL